MKASKFVFPAIILVVMIIAILNFKEYADIINQTKKNVKINYENCLTLSKDDANYKIYCEKLVTEYTEYKKCENKNTSECKRIIRKILYTDNKHVFDTFLESSIMVFFPVISCIIIFCVVYVISPYFSNSVFRNYLSRMSYSKYILSIFKKTLKFSFVIPIFMLITLFSIYLLTGSMDFSFFNYKYIFTYFVNPWLYSFIWIQIAIICTNGSKNFIVSFAKSFGVFSIIFVFIDWIMYVFSEKNINIELINMLDVFKYCDKFYDYVTMLSSFLVLFLLLTIIIVIIYMNKEKILCNIEKCEVEYDNQYK